MNSWSTRHEFEPSAAEGSSCRDTCTLNLSGFKRPPIGWKTRRGGVPVQVKSSSFDHPSKRRGMFPIAHLPLNRATLIFIHSYHGKYCPVKFSTGNE
ncbi:hypothetical protein TNCV_1442391 [Trichonephila clavipes]|uniref:Uncharacterized protein n=1 Tax=Trichonephila clavipes TaxID=2585209 RepID=A0A8X6RLT6_TRICX|nr:hypothetical protein TNCV_1442391 [Trichonephila clavipes]